MYTIYIVACKRADGKLPKLVKAAYDRIFFTVEEALRFAGFMKSQTGAEHGVFEMHAEVVSEVNVK